MKKLYKKRKAEMKKIYLIIYMNRSYSNYINIIDEVENIEQVIITDNKTKKCCYYSLELIKFVIQFNINGEKEKEKQK